MQTWVSRKERQIWLWHCHLGHPSFGYLRHLFSNLFLHLLNVDFKCNTCIMAKSHRISYSTNLNKNVVHFSLIHSNVWGPSPMTTFLGYRWFVIFVDDCTYMT